MFYYFDIYLLKEILSYLDNKNCICNKDKALYKLLCVNTFFYNLINPNYDTIKYGDIIIHPLLEEVPICKIHREFDNDELKVINVAISECFSYERNIIPRINEDNYSSFVHLNSIDKVDKLKMKIYKYFKKYIRILYSCCNGLGFKIKLKSIKNKDIIKYL